MKKLILFALAISAVAQTTSGIDIKSKGAIGDGLTDDTVNVQAAIDSAISNNMGATIVCSTGTYKISNSLVISNVLGFKFSGVGASCTFKWAGNSTTPMFLVSDAAYSTFSDFRIASSAATFLSEAFRIENGAGGAVVPMHDKFANIFVEGGNGGVGIGFRLSAAGAGGDNNNEFHLFENNWISNYTVAGFTIEGSQQHGIQFIDNHCASFGFGQYCVSGGTGANAGTKGYFIWSGGFSAQQTGADFYVGTPPNGEPSTIQNVGSEGSNRAVITDGNTGAPSPLTISGYRFSSEGLNADGLAFKLLSPGPYVISNSLIGDRYVAAPKIHWNYVPGYYAPSLSLFGNIIKGSSAKIYSNIQPTYATGNNACSSDTTCVSEDVSANTFYAPGSSPSEYFKFNSVSSDGRMTLTQTSAGVTTKILGARADSIGGSLVIGPGHIVAGTSSLTGSIAFNPFGTNGQPILGGAIIGGGIYTQGTHQSLFIGTPQISEAGFGATGIIDLGTFSSLSGAWAGTRPQMRYTANGHVFRTNSGTGNANPGNNILSILSTGPQLGTVAQTTCAVGTAGTYAYTAGGAGIKDTFAICAKDAVDAYSWRTIY